MTHWCVKYEELELSVAKLKMNAYREDTFHNMPLILTHVRESYGRKPHSIS